MESHTSTRLPACGIWWADREEEKQRDKKWCNILRASQIDLQWLMHPRNMCSVLETACKAEKLLSISKQLTGLTMSITPDLGQGYHPLCQPKWRDIHSRWNRKMAKRWLDKEEAEKKSRVDQEAVLGERSAVSEWCRQTNKLFLYVTDMESDKKLVLCWTFKFLLDKIKSRLPPYIFSRWISYFILKYTTVWGQ